MAGRKRGDYVEVEDEIFVDEDGYAVDSRGRRLDEDPGDEYGDDDPEDDAPDDADLPPMTQRQSLELILEVAPLGSEIVMCRNIDPEACSERSERIKSDPQGDHACPSCAVVVRTETTTVDELVALAVLN